MKVDVVRHNDSANKTYGLGCGTCRDSRHKSPEQDCSYVWLHNEKVNEKADCHGSNEQPEEGLLNNMRIFNYIPQAF